MTTVNTADRTGNIVKRNRFWRGRVVLCVTRCTRSGTPVVGCSHCSRFQGGGKFSVTFLHSKFGGKEKSGSLFIDAQWCEGIRKSLALRSVLLGMWSLLNSTIVQKKGKLWSKQLCMCLNRRLERLIIESKGRIKKSIDSILFKKLQKNKIKNCKDNLFHQTLFNSSS